MKSVVTKSAFATMIGRGPSAVSNWIKDGKLTREDGGGLVVIDGRERIDVDAAVERLSIEIDPGQSLGNASDTQAALSGLTNDDKSQRVPSAYTSTKNDLAQEALKVARLKTAKEEGRYVERESVERAYRREASILIAEIDTIVTREIPARLAEQFGIEASAVRHAVRTIWREERSRKEQSLRNAPEVAAIAAE